MGRSKRIYCFACGQTYVSSSIEKCTLCGKAGTVVDPDDPEALRDLQVRKQQETFGVPKTRGEFIWSVIDTCLAVPWMVMSGLVAFGLIVAGITILVLEGIRSEPDSPTTFVEIAVIMVLAGSLKLAFWGYLIWMRWKRVVAETAAEKRYTESAAGPV